MLADLEGRLLAYPLPNKPGWWAYRALSNNVLLEVQLTKEEWHQLHEQHRQKQIKGMRDLDKHPLNLAAVTLLGQAREHRSPDEIALNSLARFAYNNEDVPDGDDALMAQSAWG